MPQVDSPKPKLSKRNSGVVHFSELNSINKNTRLYQFSTNNLKGTASIILSDPAWKEGKALFTMVPLKPSLCYSQICVCKVT